MKIRGERGQPCLTPRWMSMKREVLLPKQGATLTLLREHLIDDLAGPVMVDGVKGFSGVKEKQEVLYLAGNTLEEVLVDFDGMVHAILPPKETFLRRVDESGDGGHDGVSDSGGEEPIVGVGDGNGPSVRDKTGVLLRDEEEEAIIEAWWRVLTSTQCLDDR